MRALVSPLLAAALVSSATVRTHSARQQTAGAKETSATACVVINGSAAPSPKNLRVGTTYRIRIADIAGFRQNLFARVVRDSALASWRAVAKDGFTLPSVQATIRPSVARVTSGETADFELTPEEQGELRLEIAVPTRGGGVQIQGTVRLHVGAR